MFKVLDRYIIRQFFGGFIFTLILFVSVALTIDIGEHLKNFVQHNLTFHQVLTGFYIYFIPQIITFLGPYFVFITVIYFTSRLANKSEIIAMFNSGMSFSRFLRPYIITSSVIACFFWFAYNFIIPKTDRHRLAFENKYIAFQPTSSDINIHRRINDSTFFYFRIFDNYQKLAYNLSIENFSQGKLVSKTLAERGSFNELTKTWTLENYFTRTIDSKGIEKVEKGEKLNTTITLDPTLLTKRWTHVQELDREELLNLIAELKAQGSENYKMYELEFYRRTAKCFGIIILTIIGVILASKKIRGGLGIHLVLGISLGSIYEVIVKFADSFALKASLTPMLAAWLPNIIYILVAYYLWKKIQE